MRSIIFKKKTKRKHVEVIPEKPMRLSRWEEATRLIEKLDFKNHPVSESEFHDIEQRIWDKNIELNASQLLAVVILVRRYSNGAAIVKIDTLTLEIKMSILGNPVGTGKTRVLMALVALIKNSNARSSPKTHVTQIVSSLIKVVEKVTHHVPCAIVYVGNDQISVQWEREAKLCNLRACTIFTKKSAKQELLQLVNENDVLIVRGAGFKTLLAEHKHIDWSLFIYDEPDCHMNSSFQTIISAHFHVLVTATWNALHQSPYGNRNYLAQIGLRDKIFTKNKHAFVVCTAQKLDLPEPTTHTIFFKPLLVDAMLRGLVSNEVDNMIDSENWQAVANVMMQMGAKVSSTPHVEVVMDSMKIKLKEAVTIRDRVRTVIDAFQPSTLEYNNLARRIYNADKTVTEVQKQMIVLKERLQALEAEGCIICLDEEVTNSTMTPCNHIFCQNCIVQWIRNNVDAAICPTCRAPITIKQLTVTMTKDKMKEIAIPENNITGRSQAVRFILNREQKLSESHKFKPKTLLFSNDAHAIRKIKIDLLNDNVIATTIDGHKSKRRKNLLQCTDGDATVLLLNTSTDGAGLDSLQRSTTSIIFLSHSE